MLMGTIVAAHCEHCDFNRYLAVGAGMTNYGKAAKWPVWCTRCKALCLAIHKAEELNCSECGSSEVKRANDPAVWLGEGRVTLKWRLRVERGEPRERTWLERLRGRTPEVPTRSVDLELTDGDYLCPACGQFGLKFSPIGLFD